MVFGLADGWLGLIYRWEVRKGAFSNKKQRKYLLMGLVKQWKMELWNLALSLVLKSDVKCPGLFVVACFGADWMEHQV